MNELSASAGSERYEARSDVGAYRFRRGRGTGISGRMRLTSLKWATYKLKNNNRTVLAAA